MAEPITNPLEAAYQEQFLSAQRARAAQQQVSAQQQAKAQQQAQEAAAQAELNRDRTLGEVGRDTALSLASGVGTLAGAGFGLANAATMGILDRASGGAVTDTLSDFGTAMSEAQSPQLQARRAGVMQEFSDNGIAAGLGSLVTTPSVAADMLVQSAPMFIPGVGVAGAASRVQTAGALARGVSESAAALAGSQAAAKAALATNAAIGGGLGNVDAITNARAAGLGESEQQLAGLGGAAAGALLSYGSNKLTGASGLQGALGQRLAGGSSALPSTAGSAIQQVGGGVLREGAQEYIEEGGQTVIGNVAGQRDAFEGAGTNAAIGGLIGGVLGGALAGVNVRKPTATRAQVEQQMQTVQAELDAAGLGGGQEFRLLDRLMGERQQTNDDRTMREILGAETAQREAQQQTELAAALPTVTFEADAENIDVGNAPVPVPTEISDEIDVGAVVPPGLTGLNRIAAEQRARVASQPPRMGVQELTMEQYAPQSDQMVADLPIVEDVRSRSVEDIIRETAPIERVLQQFGPAVAGREQARRAEVAAAPVDAPAPVDVSTPKLLGAFRSQVRDALVAKAGVTAGQAKGPQFEALVDAAVRANAAPGTPAFDTVVGVEANRRLADVERNGKQSALLGAVVNNYPATQDQRVEAAFDAQGVATTEEELFGAAPEAQPAPAFRDAPAASVGTVERDQQWVSPQGEVFTVAAMFNGRPQLRSGAKALNKTKAALEREGWSLREPVQQAVQRAATAPAKDLTLKETIADLGGIDIAYRQDITGDTQARPSEAAPGRGRVFTQNGTSPDDMAMQLAERNFVPPQEVARDGGVAWLYDTVNRALNGEAIYAEGSNAQLAQFEAMDARPTAELLVVDQPTTDAPSNSRYNLADWADYMTYPGAAQLNALVEMKGQEGNPQPMLAAALYGIDLAGDLAELSTLATAAQAHPEYNLMSAEGRSEIAARTSVAINRLTGATFDLADTAPKFVRPVGAELQRALELSEDQYIAAINPTGQTSTADDIVIVNQGDLDMPASAALVATFNDNAGAEVEVYADAAGTLYAQRGGEVVGQIESREGETLNIVVQQAQGQGIGTGLAAELIRRQPFAQAGSLSPAGEATRRAAFRRVKAQQARFSQAVAGAKQVSQVAFDRGIAAAERNTGRPIIGVNTTAELSNATGIPVPASARGMFYQGNIYLVRENIQSNKDLAFTVAHEMGHNGLDALLGDNLRAATNRMWANADMRTRIKTKMAELKMAESTESERRDSRTLAAEEVLADMLASGERLNKDVWAKLRSGVREFFARVFGMRNAIVTNQEVDDLLSGVARVIKGAPAAQVAKEIDTALWLTNPQMAADADPKFSKLQADLDEVLAKAQAEPDKQVIPLADITKAAGQASVDVARSTLDALRNGKVGELYTKHFMHLNQLRDWHDKMFGGRIGALAKVKREKEAFFNQLNSRPSELNYRGEKLGGASINDIAKEWSQFGRQNPQKHNALNNLMQFSTFYKVFPDLSWDQQNDIDYEAAGFTVEERQAEHKRLQALYRAVGDRGQKLYKQSQAIYSDRWKRRYDELLAELDRVGKVNREEVTDADGVTQIIEKYKADVRMAMKRMSEGPYSPLQRNGEHTLEVRDANGTTVYFAAYDSKADAEIARKQYVENMERQGITEGVATVGRRKDFNLVLDGAGARGNLDELTKNIRGDMAAALPADMDARSRDKLLSTLADSLTEAYLQALPQSAFMKHARTRKNVQGFDTDAFRSFADYTLRSARDIAGIKYDGRVANAMTDIQRFVDDTRRGEFSDQEGIKQIDVDKLQTVANAVKNQHAASLDVDQNAIVNTLSQTAFVYFMTSPSQMFLNATQTYMVAFPRLAARYGLGGAIRELNKAAGQYFRSKFDLLNPDSVLNKNAATDSSEAQVADALRALYEDGTLDFTQAHDLAGVADGNEATLSPYMQKAMEVMSYAMHKSEVFNRQVTAAATVRLELAKRQKAGKPVPAKGTPEYQALQAELATTARDAIDATHFDYSQNNKPAVMQGPLGKLALQFQQYRFHMLSMIGKDIRDGFFGADPEAKREARAALSYIMGMQLALTGVAGTILAPFVFGLADAFKDDDDLTTSRQDFLNYFGKYATHGVLAGLVDTTRIGADTLIPYLGDRAYEPVGGKASEVLAYHIEKNLGPWVGLLGDAVDGAAAVANGDTYKASQELLPKPFRDVVKSLYENQNGARNMQGVMYNEPSPLSTVTQFFGLRSAERRDVENDRSVVYRANKTAYDLKDRYLLRLSSAVTLGDNAAVAEAQQEIESWNQRYPDMAIKMQDISQAIRSRFRTEANAAQTGIVSGRLPGQTIDAVLGR